MEQPETNGVAERFIRTLKEQVIYGRVFMNLEELRQAVGEFISTYNQYWLLEKNGYRGPLDLREHYVDKEAA